MGMLPEHEAILKRFQTEDERKKQHKNTPEVELEKEDTNESYTLPKYHPKKPYVIERKLLPPELKETADIIRANRIARSLWILCGAMGSAVTVQGASKLMGPIVTALGPLSAHRMSNDIREFHKEVSEKLEFNGDFVKQRVRSQLNGDLPLPSELEKSHPHFLVGEKGELIFLPKNTKIEAAKQKIHNAKEKVPILRNWVPVRYRGITKFSK